MILFKFFILGILTSFLFPPFFILPLGFVIIPYLVDLLLKNSHKKSYLTFFYYGFFYGLGFLAVFLSWIHNPFLVFDYTKPFAILIQSNSPFQDIATTTPKKLSTTRPTIALRDNSKTRTPHPGES